jgi:putative ribosome biogenesis GTPase RsgA
MKIRHSMSYNPLFEFLSLTFYRSSDSAARSAVLVMGITGVGKSTFISKLVGEDTGIGHELTSCEYSFNSQN